MTGELLGFLSHLQGLTVTLLGKNMLTAVLEVVRMVVTYICACVLNYLNHGNHSFQNVAGGPPASRSKIWKTAKVKHMPEGNYLALVCI